MSNCICEGLGIDPLCPLHGDESDFPLLSTEVGKGKDYARFHIGEPWSARSLYAPKNYAVHSTEVGRIVKEFTGSPRPWTSFPADKIEVMLRHHGLIPQNAWYAGFDAESEHLVFRSNPAMDMPDRVIIDMREVAMPAFTNKLLKEAFRPPEPNLELPYEDVIRMLPPPPKEEPETENG